MIIMIQGYIYYKASWHIIHSILQRESLNTLSFSALANSYSFHYFWQCCRHLWQIEYRNMNKKTNVHSIIIFWMHRFCNCMKWYIFSDAVLLRYCKCNQTIYIFQTTTGTRYCLEKYWCFLGALYLISPTERQCAVKQHEKCNVLQRCFYFDGIWCCGWFDPPTLLPGKETFGKINFARRSKKWVFVLNLSSL